MTETDVQGDREPEARLEQGAEDMETRLDGLGGDIADAKQRLEARKEDADIGGDVAGDWEDTEDDTNGEDPAAFDDPETDEEDEDEY
jgi:hypothetical protein